MYLVEGLHNHVRFILLICISFFGVIGPNFKVEDWKKMNYPLAVQHQMEAELSKITSLRFGPAELYVHLFLFELKELAIVIYHEFIMNAPISCL